MQEERKRAQAASFGQAADIYERARPTYPADALDWLVPCDARRVLDLGAGTGKLSRALAARGLDVVAIDPAPNMLEQLRAKHTDIASHVGTAEAIPLPSASVDAVFVAQAWHWVDPARAVPEVARVLRPGGTLGLVWNARDDRVVWVAEFNRIVDRGAPVCHYEGTPKVGAPFASMEMRQYGWTYALDETGCLELAQSRSVFITLPEVDRKAMLEALKAMLPGAPRMPDGRIAMPYVTRCFRTHI